MNTIKIPENKSILLYDGVCNFCDNTVNFVIKKDPQGHFNFASLQSETGQLIQKSFGLNVEKLDSLVLIENKKLYRKSSAALRIAKKLGGLYPLLYAFIIVPPFIRDAVYDLVARNRYKWFGKKDRCLIPDQSVRSRFLDS
jgi:predicted DCC family thiol-disulfide oxidoreductase YuxK